MLSFTRKNGQLSFYLAHKLYKNGPKKGTVPEKINSHLLLFWNLRISLFSTGLLFPFALYAVPTYRALPKSQKESETAWSERYPCTDRANTRYLFLPHSNKVLQFVRRAHTLLPLPLPLSCFFHLPHAPLTFAQAKLLPYPAKQKPSSVPPSAAGALRKGVRHGK